MMTLLAARYPGYGWEHNQGYATRDHRDAIRRMGLTPFHRRSFLALQRTLAGDQLDFDLLGDPNAATRGVDRGPRARVDPGDGRRRGARLRRPAPAGGRRGRLTRAGALDAGLPATAQNRPQRTHDRRTEDGVMAEVTRSRLYFLGFAEPDIARYVLELIKNARDKKELTVTDWAMIGRHAGGRAQDHDRQDASIRERRAAAGFGGVAGVVLAGLSGPIGVGAIAAGAAIGAVTAALRDSGLKDARPRDDLAPDGRGPERDRRRRPARRRRDGSTRSWPRTPSSTPPTEAARTTSSPAGRSRTPSTSTSRAPTTEGRRAAIRVRGAGR